MEGKKRQAVVLGLIEAMSGEGSWSGETHIQKCAYFLQQALNVPLGFDFILYKHGPFSFDLREELGEMRSDRIIDFEAQLPYGPSLRAGSTAESLMRRFPKTIGMYQDQMQFVAAKVSHRDVVSLERLSTALYVTSEDLKRTSIEARAERIHDLKPHISTEQARIAVEEVDKILSEAAEIAAHREG